MFCFEIFFILTQLKEHVKELQIDQTEERIKIESFDNLAEIMSYSSPKKKGNINCSKKAFQDCVLASIVGNSPVGTIESNGDDSCSQGSRSKRFIKTKFYQKHSPFQKEHCREK